MVISKMIMSQSLWNDIFEYCDHEDERKKQRNRPSVPYVSAEIVFAQPYEPCMIEEFFKQEQLRAPWLRSTSCLIACPCSRHRVIC
jgi:hypothetical protein